MTREERWLRLGSVFSVPRALDLEFKYAPLVVL